MNYVKSLDLFGTRVHQTPCITGKGAPTSATEGAVGCLYMDTNTEDVYKCVAVNTDGTSVWQNLLEKRPKTYGVSIDLTESDPNKAVTYINDAIGMQPASHAYGFGQWLDTSLFKRIRPCRFKDGQVLGYLKPEDFAIYEDGFESVLGDETEGDVMIEIPCMGYQISKTENTLTVQVTEELNKEGFCYKAHTRDRGGLRTSLYIGAYLGTVIDGKLHSLGFRTPTGNYTITKFREFAQAHNDEHSVRNYGYDFIGFFQVTLLQCLYLIMCKTLDSEAGLGRGYVSASTYSATGTTHASGMCSGSWNMQEHIKFLGIEDFYGNLMQYIDGVVVDENGDIRSVTDHFERPYTLYDIRHRCDGQRDGYMSQPYGTNELGFLVQETGGSSTTGFRDYSALYTGTAEKPAVAFFGSNYLSGYATGAFQLYVKQGMPTGIGARLMFL